MLLCSPRPDPPPHLSPPHPLPRSEEGLKAGAPEAARHVQIRGQDLHLRPQPQRQPAARPQPAVEEAALLRRHPDGPGPAVPLPQGCAGLLLPVLPIPLLQRRRPPPRPGAGARRSGRAGGGPPEGAAAAAAGGAGHAVLLPRGQAAGQPAGHQQPGAAGLLVHRAAPGAGVPLHGQRHPLAGHGGGGAVGQQDPAHPAGHQAVRAVPQRPDLGAELQAGVQDRRSARPGGDQEAGQQVPGGRRAAAQLRGDARPARLAASPRRVGAGPLSDVRAVAGARPGDAHAVRPGPDEAPPLRPHPGAGAGGAGAVGGFHAHRPRLPKAAAGRHELPPDALQAALPAEPGQQVRGPGPGGSRRGARRGRAGRGLPAVGLPAGRGCPPCAGRGATPPR